MKLNKETLEKLIEESLNDVFAEQTDAEIARAKEDAAQEKEEAANAESQVSKLEADKAEAEAEAARLTKTMPESFQIKKSRLQELVLEEVLEAKKQGIL
jgi:hypothetical protein